MTNATFEALQQAAKGLLYPSEQDNPFKAILWSKAFVGKEALDAATVKKLVKAQTGTKVETQTLDDFFAPVSTDAGFEGLKSALKQNLTGLQVYRIGGTDKQVYVVGKTPEGDFAGVVTRVVET